MKTVWIVNHYGQSPGGPGGTRHFHLAQYLLDHDWKAVIIASSYSARTGQDRLESHQKFRLGMESGVPFLRVRTRKYRGNGLGRILNMVSFAWNVVLKTTTEELEKPDVVIGSSVHPLAALAGAILAKRHKVPFVFEVRDLWPQTLIDMGKLKSNSILAWVLRKLELWLYRNASRTVVLLPEAWRYIVPLGIDKEKVIWISNGVDLGMYPDPLPPVTAESFCLMYLGSHGEANGLDTVLEAMKHVQESVGPHAIKLRLIGDGPLKPALIEMAEKLGLSNTEFEGIVAKNLVPAIAAKADAFVIAVLDLPDLYKYGISMNKIFDYLAAARPVVIASNAANNPVEEGGAGISVPAADSRALAAAILKLSEMPLATRLEMGNRGRKLVKKEYCYSVLAGKLARVLDDVTGTGAGVVGLGYCACGSPTSVDNRQMRGSLLKDLNVG